jgi:hypothetical protein
MRLLSKKAMVIAAVASFLVMAQTSARYGKEDNGITRKNLRVIPHTIGEDQLIGTMREINKALGVKCDYCHKEIPGKITPEGHPAHDFASDDKLQKRIARKMMLMTKNINEKLDDMGDGQLERVSCITCHRGHTQPAHTLDTSIHSILKDILR